MDLATTLTSINIPVMAILIVAGLVWLSMEVLRKGLESKKFGKKGIVYSAVAAVPWSILVIATIGKWNWLSLLWCILAGWLAANYGHKFFKRLFGKFIKEKPA